MFGKETPIKSLPDVRKTEFWKQLSLRDDELIEL